MLYWQGNIFLHNRIRVENIVPSWKHYSVLNMNLGATFPNSLIVKAVKV